MAGCTGGDLIVQRQGSMEGRLNQMMQAQNAATAQIAEISMQLKELKEQVSRQAAAEKSSVEALSELQGKVGMLSRRVERAEVQLDPPKPSRIELVNSDADAEVREEKVQSDYMKAFGLFSANNYSAAAEAFRSLISSYPESESAANARYWLGECYFAEGRFQEAVEAYATVLERKPSAARGADAMLKSGLAWYGLKDAEKGRATMKALIEKYPASEAAVKAKEQLERR